MVQMNTAWPQWVSGLGPLIGHLHEHSMALCILPMSRHHVSLATCLLPDWNVRPMCCSHSGEEWLIISGETDGSCWLWEALSGTQLIYLTEKIRWLPGPWANSTLNDIAGVQAFLKLDLITLDEIVLLLVQAFLRILWAASKQDLSLDF